MDDLYLSDPDPQYQTAFFDMLADFQRASEVNPDIHAAERDFQAYVASLREAAQGRGLAEGWVPWSTHWLANGDGEILGESHLRYHLTPGLAIVGGHIGYRIRPSARRRGNGTMILALTLDRARAIGLPRVLVTCDTDNIGSARIIEKNGGVLAHQFFHTPSLTNKNHYWIDLLKPAGVKRCWQPNARAAQEYQAAYPESLYLQAGDEVVLRMRDTEWSGWVWCIDQYGKSAWVPEAYLDVRGSTGTARRDYASAELSIAAAEPLMLHFEESGWHWATNELGYSGWVPAGAVSR